MAVDLEILTATKTYLNFTSDSDEVPPDEVLQLLIQRVMEDYQEQRNYPEGMSAALITADVEKYFSMKKMYVATEVIPAMVGKIGGEGLYSLIDNQVSKYWKYPLPVYLPDVVPYCGVV